MESPLTVAENSSVIGIGLVMLALQVRVSPSTLPDTSWSPMRPEVLPVKVSPLVVIAAVTSWPPIGVLMVIFQLQSAAAMRVSPEGFGGAPKRGRAQRAR